MTMVKTVIIKSCKVPGKGKSYDNMEYNKDRSVDSTDLSADAGV